jgi:hypothetical protein
LAACINAIYADNNSVQLFIFFIWRKLKMCKKNFCIGMGMGLIVGSTITMAVNAKRHCPKSVWGRTLKTVAQVADSISDMMGW